jgi:hypothetical protein
VIYLLAIGAVMSLTMIVLGVITLATGWVPSFARSLQLRRLRGLVLVVGGVNLLILSWRIYLDSKSVDHSGSGFLSTNATSVSTLLTLGMVFAINLADRRQRRGSWTRVGVEMTGLVVGTLAGMYVVLMIVLTLAFSS